MPWLHELFGHIENYLAAMLVFNNTLILVFTSLYGATTKLNLHKILFISQMRGIRRIGMGNVEKKNLKLEKMYIRLCVFFYYKFFNFFYF